MPNYSIFTICSKNYKDSYEFVIDSWLKNTIAEKIYIYTDDDGWKIDNHRISLVPLLDKSEDWLKIVKAKTKVLKHFINNVETDNFVFIDIDCYIREDLGYVFEKDFDIAVTRLEQLTIAVSTGVFFVKNKEKLDSFIEEWSALQDVLDIKGKARQRTCSNNQKAFSILIRNAYKDKKLNVLGLDVDIYNRKAKPGRIQDLIEQERNGKKIEVLHFYNTSYRDKDYVNQVFRGLKL